MACDPVLSTAYDPTRIVTDPGPDQIRTSGDERSLQFYDVRPEFLGKDTFLHTNCGNNVSIDCVQRYKALELSVVKRMSNRWQMQGSYVWSRLDGVQAGISTSSTTIRCGTCLDFTNPNNVLEFVGGAGRGANDQPQAFKLLGSYQAPWGITLGANYQALSGLPRDRRLNVAFAQGTRAIPVEPRGTYRGDFLNLLSVRADKSFRLYDVHRASVVAEVHNLLNSHAGQNDFGLLTQNFVDQAAFNAAMKTTSYFGRVQEIIAPRVLKLGFKLTF